MPRGSDKTLRVLTSPVPNSDNTEVELRYGLHEIGSLTLHPDDFAEFVESLREGFRVVISGEPTRRAAAALAKRRDAAEFTDDLPDADEQDD